MANYGFISQTLAEDRDALDVQVFCTEEISPMTLREARAVGMMTMIDHGEPGHKTISVLMADPIYSDIQRSSDFPRHMLKMLKRFFLDYKMLENKQVEVEDILRAKAADAIVESCLSRYSRARRTGEIKELIS